MLIKGKIIYNHDLTDKRNRYFIYDGKDFQVTDDEKQETFDDRAIELEYDGIFCKNYQVKNFLEKLEKANGYLSISEVVFSQEELNVGLDYLKEAYPISIKYSDFNENTIADYFPYDYCGFSLLEVLDDIDTYLYRYPVINVPFYSDNKYIEYLEFQLSDNLYYLFDIDGKYTTIEDALNYLSECYKADNKEPEYLFLENEEWMLFEALGIEEDNWQELENKIKQYIKETENTDNTIETDNTDITENKLAV